MALKVWSVVSSWAAVLSSSVASHYPTHYIIAVAGSRYLVALVAGNIATFFSMQEEIFTKSFR